MSLVRTALRMAALNALKGGTPSTGPTLAKNRVYDSRINDFSPETYPADALPTIIITTDDDEGDGLSEQNGGPPFKRMVKLVMEFAMIQGFYVDGADTDFVPGYPATDAEHEASLDLLELQIAQRLAYDLDSKCALFRSFTRVMKYDCHRQTLEDTGVKIAARVLTWQVEVSDDQVSIYKEGTPSPTGLDVLPLPLRTIAKSLPAGAALDICNALAAALSPLTSEQLQGLDVTMDNTIGSDVSDTFEAPIEIEQP